MRRNSTRRVGGQGLGAALVVAMAFGLVGCTPSDGDAAGSVELQVALVHPTTSPIYEIVSEVGRNITERTDGRVTVAVFPDSQLGSNEDAAEQALSGAPTVAQYNASGAATIGKVADYLAIGMPYVVSSVDKVETLVASELFQELESDLAENDFIVLAGNWMFGTRHIITTDRGGHPEPEDLVGVTLRVPPGEQFATFFDATPVQSVTLAPAETYTGMEQGVVDGADGPLAQMIDWGLVDLGKSVTLTGHMIDVTGFMMGAETWNRLSPEDQEIVREEFLRGGRDFSAAVVVADAALRAEMEASGIVFVDPDASAYRALAQRAVEASAAAETWSDGLLERLEAAMEGDR